MAVFVDDVDARHERDPGFRKPLPAIHRADDAPTVRKAVEGGADVNARVCGRTALYEAAFLGGAELAEVLRPVTRHT